MFNSRGGTSIIASPWHLKHMTDRDEVRLANQAAGDIPASILTNMGGWINKNLYDKPLIEYLNSDEQPEFVKEISDTHKIRKNKNESREELFARDGLGKSYFVVTDQRVIFIMGSDDGDVMFDFGYEGISRVGVEQDAIILHFSQGITTWSGEIAKNATKVKGYIKQKIEDANVDCSKPPAGRFYVKTKSAETGSHTDTISKQGDCLVVFKVNELILKNSWSEQSISYDEIAHVKFYDGLYLRSKHFSASRHHHKPPSGTLSYDLLRLTVMKPDEPVHMYLITNMYISRRGFHGMIHPAIDRVYEFLCGEAGKNNVTNKEKFVFTEWIEKNTNLEIKEWDNNAVSTKPKLKGSIETKGKSKATQIGPFIRGKSKSESEIQLEDTSVNYDRGGHKSRVNGFIIYDDGVLADTDPYIRVAYNEIEGVMKTNAGLALIINHLTYKFSFSYRDQDVIEEAVDFIKGKIQDAQSGQQDDSTDSWNLAEKIRQIKELEEEGIITEEEFELKKKQLMNQI